MTNVKDKLEEKCYMEVQIVEQEIKHLNLAILKNIATGTPMPIPDSDKELSPVSTRTDDGMFGERYQKAIKGSNSIRSWVTKPVKGLKKGLKPPTVPQKSRKYLEKSQTTLF